MFFFVFFLHFRNLSKLLLIRLSLPFTFIKTREDFDAFSRTKNANFYRLKDLLPCFRFKSVSIKMSVKHSLKLSAIFFVKKKHNLFIRVHGNVFGNKSWPRPTECTSYFCWPIHRNTKTKEKQKNSFSHQIFEMFSSIII